MRRTLVALLVLLLSVTPALAQQAVEKSGSITTNGDIVALQTLGTANGAVQITGTWTGTIQFEGTIDGATWVAIPGTPIAGGSAVTSVTANGAWTFAGALKLMRLRASAAMTGTAITTQLFTQARAGGAGGGGGSFSGGTVTSPILFPDGTSSLPAIAFSAQPSWGVYRSGNGPTGVFGTTEAFFWDSGHFRLSPTHGLEWATSANLGGVNLSMQRDGGSTTGSLRIFSGTTPTQSGTTCGTGPTIVGNNTLGSVTLGTSPGLPCTIVFNGTWAAAPKCFLNPEVLTTGTTTVRATSITTTGFVITSTAALVATDKVSWFCPSS